MHHTGVHGVAGVISTRVTATSIALAASIVAETSEPQVGVLTPAQVLAKAGKFCKAEAFKNLSINQE
jgi:hypothetical protein